MDTLNARPNLLKQANLSALRRALKAKFTATRAELAAATKISSTTVRSLLSEMLENGEIESMGLDASSGGRKAERYRLKPDRYHCAAICMTEKQAHGLLVDLCGNIVETTALEAGDDGMTGAVTAFLDELFAKREIRSIGLGVPGVVDGVHYWKQDGSDSTLYRIGLGDSVLKRYGVPVVLENDLKATAVGFGRCYEKQYPREDPENINMAYLQFEQGCISGGFLVGGRVVRGCNHFAGELGLVPMEDDRSLSEHMGERMDDARYVNHVIHTISWVCGILNPQYVALGGPALRTECIGPIGDGLAALLPKRMLPEILHAPDMWHDYHDGMAYLTAGKMFDEVQFVKE